MHPGGDLAPGSEAKAAKDVGDVVLDCLGSHEKPLGNLRVRQPFREQWNDIALATAQYLEPAAARGVSNSAHAYAEGAEQRGHTVGVAPGAESLEDGQSGSGLSGRAGDISLAFCFGESKVDLGSQPWAFAIAEFAERHQECWLRVLAPGSLHAAAAQPGQGPDPRRGKGAGDGLQTRRGCLRRVDVAAAFHVDEMSPQRC
jgi:hypothetical protein